MSRINLFEFEDLKIFPQVIRNGMTDYLGFILTKLGIYDPVVPIIDTLLVENKSNCLIDLCSGGGGATESIYKKLIKNHPSLQIVLTDLYPNLIAFESIQNISNKKIDYYHQPVDATNVPDNLKGVRTMFSAFHHFTPEKAKEVLQDAVNKNEPIAIFDGAERNFLMVISLFLLHPLFYLIFTPFIKPFKLVRIIFTYLVPLLPIFTIWDGLASVLKLYSAEEMLQMTHELENNSFEWTAGTIIGNNGIRIAYLVGQPT